MILDKRWGPYALIFPIWKYICGKKKCGDIYLFAGTVYVCVLWKRPGGDSHIKGTGMLVGNFEKNP